MRAGVKTSLSSQTSLTSMRLLVKRQDSLSDRSGSCDTSAAAAVAPVDASSTSHSVSSSSSSSSSP